MFDEFLEKVKAENFVIKEIVTDKDSSGNPIFRNDFQKAPSPTVLITQQKHCTKSCTR